MYLTANFIADYLTARNSPIGVRALRAGKNMDG